MPVNPPESAAATPPAPTPRIGDWVPRVLLRPLTSLRPWLCALGALLALEGMLRILCPPDPRVLRAPLQGHDCMADSALQRLIDDRDHRPPSDPTVDIVLIGDSVFASVENRPGGTLHESLQQALQEKGIPARVYNLAAGGAHAADVLGAVRRLHAALSPRPQGLRHLRVLLSTNPIFFSRRHSQPPLLYPCLFDAEPQDLGPLDRARDGVPSAALRGRLGLPHPPDAVTRTTAHFLAQHLYLYQQRRRMAAALLGSDAPPATALHDRLRALPLHRPPARGTSPTAAAADSPWHVRGMTASHFASSYDLIPTASDLAVNWQATVELARWLAAHRDLAVQVQQVPQNHHMMAAYTGTPAYRALSDQLAALFAAAHLPYVSHDGAPQLTRDHFQDLDHLTAAGNRALAALLADDLLQPLDASGTPSMR